MDAYDALIIGAGPAGSSCAAKLGQAGLNVIVIDKAVFPRNKVCAGWVTPAVLTSLSIDVSAYADGRVIQPITGFVTGVMGGKAIHTDYKHVVSYGIRRTEFDDFLLQRSGACVDQATAFESIKRIGDKWIVNERYIAPLLVGAGGHFCPVARYLGAKPGSTEAAVKAQEVEFLMDDDQLLQCDIAPERPELYFCPDLSGYGWVFRKGNYLNIGLGRQARQGLGRHVRQFVDWLEAMGKIPPGIQQKFLGHAYLLYGETARKIIDDGILLIGDSAGLAYPQSGEGIRPAIESGMLAAKAIVAANKNYDKAHLKKYEELLTERFGQRDGDDKLHFLDMVTPALTQYIGKKILSSHWASRHIVIDRWFLHNNQQPLVIWQ